MKNLIIIFAAILSSIVVISCNKEGASGDCSSTVITVNASTTNSANSGATGTITVTSPIGSEYTYRINNGSYQALPSFINLAAGTYNITAKNAAGCTGTTSVTISGFDCSSTVITVAGTTTSTSASSPTGSITITSPIGSNYTYSINSSPFQSHPVFNNLGLGAYAVVAKDLNGCTGSHIFNINTVCNGTTAFAGTDTGSHKIYVNGIYGIVPDIRDTFICTATSATTVQMYSNALKRTLTGTLDASNCDKINFDSLIYGPGDTLVINSSTLGVVKIYNIRAGGDAILSGTTLSTSIKIKKGNSNLAILPNLSNVELRGIFKKL